MKSLPNLRSKYHADKTGHISTYFYKAGSYGASRIFLTLKQKFKVAKKAKTVEGFYGTRQELPKRKKFCVFCQWKFRFDFLISILKFIYLW